MTVNVRGALGSTAVTVDVRGALGFFAASCCWRSAKSSSPAANDSPSRPARTTRVIILSSSASSSLDVWDEEPNQPAQPPCVTPHDVDSHGVGLGERVAQVHVVVHAPAEVLVEGRGAVEHVCSCP